ncbi:hypothetical protein MTER_35070 [Mycolicibacter terrae]|jgi:hypothetical protein|uniref:Transmembrane protein n=1 Tax=Mycolicibacter terrae TaxID=1788 RepID=A0AAD1I0P1_9MYCO|nr:hypothetical protein [Mycolicibacter terrae]ORW96012.1 hypothetical protein AWC28_10770 [Mycolicibacter terrae]BBX24096.1 hypothetical protein MTER_35070 [Mycolicibacter terrae]SNV56498.1 transmembrane protein [Mycolicibacter terrae]
MTAWFNYAATLKILVFGLLVGGALPALFAVGVRVNAVGNNVPASTDGTVNAKRSVLIALSWAIFLAVLVVVVIGVLFIARDFLGHHFGWYLLGAKPK